MALVDALRIRCPSCGHVEEVCDQDDPGLYEEGDRRVACAECGHDYVVSVVVSYTYTSPAMEADIELDSP